MTKASAHNYRWKQRRKRWADRLPFPCSLCGQPVQPWDPWDLDHTTPTALGGTDDTARPAHRSCNRSAGAILRTEIHRAGAAFLAGAAPDWHADDNWLTGFIDLGYRWLTGVGGSFDTYRSIVDLGSGPKLLATDFTIRDSRRRLFRPHRRLGVRLGRRPLFHASMWT